ncbi:hypothetical protein CJ030_MR0G012607 [Morella rubra]|uniref:Sieve element occlusion N-terminal domain-containing protein n=1 Tax=Morella rubra TaxID=262757 RepID=A0A6A1UH24_9ROSI|nr:hypothetical protein CJ030_MR0G012607 [Morella rubra]
MATITNKMLLATAQSVRQAVKGELNVLTMPDDQIMNQIYATHVHADEKFDADSLFAVTENILKRATLLVDNVVLGTQAHYENVEEKAPKTSFSPPLCTLKALSCEMACKAPGEEIAHKTTMSILNKLSNYSWEAKAALTLAAFALDYGDFWLLVQLHSSDQLAKSMGILRRLLGYHYFGSLYDSDVLHLWKRVSIEVLKKKNVLLFISSLDISMDEISVLKPVYDGLRTKDQYKIVWIPVVEQWTDELRKKFEMLRSKMPWYIVQYFSPVVGIKFIKAEWNFKNKPIVVVMNPLSRVEHTNAFHQYHTNASSSFLAISGIGTGISDSGFSKKIK